jgi:hypothetical protein
MQADRKLQKGTPEMADGYIENTDNQQNQPAFFVLRVREEKLEAGGMRWRGEVLDTASNTVRAFEDWPDLVDLIADALDNLPTYEPFNPVLAQQL